MKALAQVSLSLLLLCGVCAGVVGAQTAPVAVPDLANQNVLPDTVRRGLLAGIAFYPDEVISAIFAVSQEPAALMGRRKSKDSEFQQGYAFLAAFPEILGDLNGHPIATRAVGAVYRSDPEGTWATIDQIRADYAARAGIPVSKAVATMTPPAVPLYVPLAESDSSQSGSEGDSSGTAEMEPATGEIVVETATAQAVNDTTMAPVVVQGVVVQPVAPPPVEGVVGTGTVQGQNASAAGYGVAVQGENAAHVGAGGVVVTEDGKVTAGSTGGTVVQTQNGPVVMGHTGQTNVDTQAGTFDSSRSASVSNSQGQGVSVHQEANGSWDSNSYQRNSNGSVQANNGQGAEWTHQGSGQVTDSGASHSTSTQIETNSGQSVDVEHSTSVEKTDTGVDVEHGGSATTGNGQTYEWGNRDAGGSSNTTAAARTSAEQGWNHFSSKVQGGNQISQYARQGNSLKSSEVFSGLSLDPAARKSALSVGQIQQSNAFKSVEPMIMKDHGGALQDRKPTPKDSLRSTPTEIQRKGDRKQPAAINRNVHQPPGGRRGGRGRR